MTKIKVPQVSIGEPNHFSEMLQGLADQKSERAKTLPFTGFIHRTK